MAGTWRWQERVIVKQAETPLVPISRALCADWTLTWHRGVIAESHVEEVRLDFLILILHVFFWLMMLGFGVLLVRFAVWTFQVFVGLSAIALAPPVLLGVCVWRLLRLLGRWLPHSTTVSAADPSSNLRPTEVRHGGPTEAPSETPRPENHIAIDPVSMLEAASRQGDRQQVFWISVVLLAAQIARADGTVNAAEEFEFKNGRLFKRLRLAVPWPAEWSDTLKMRLWRHACAHVIASKPFVLSLASYFADQPTLLSSVHECLRRIARADSAMNDCERDFLLEFAIRLGLPVHEYTEESTRSQDDLLDAYRVLGVHRDATLDEIRAVWRRLVKENHPDTLGRGSSSPEATVRANQRLVAINEAWKTIRAKHNSA